MSGNKTKQNSQNSEIILEKQIDFVTKRSLYINNMDTILENLSSRRENKKIQSDDLFDFGDFGSGDSEPKKSLNLNYNLPNLADIDVLMMEKESLGLYVSGNPLGRYTEFVEYLRDYTFEENLHLILIEKIRKIFTRAGKLMLAIDITTHLESNLEMVIFPKHANDLVKIIEAKELFWVIGKIQEPKPIVIEANQNINENSNQNSVNNDSDNSSDNGSVITSEETNSTTTAPTVLNEYVDKKKLLVDWLAPYDKGIVELFSQVKLNLSERQLKVLQIIDYDNIKKNPSKWENIINYKLQQNQTSSFENKKIIHLQLPKSLGADNLKLIKSLLQKTEFDKAIALKISVELTAGYRELPQTFFVVGDDYDKIISVGGINTNG